MVTMEWRGVVDASPGVPVSSHVPFVDGARNAAGLIVDHGRIPLEPRPPFRRALERTS